MSCDVDKFGSFNPFQTSSKARAAIPFQSSDWISITLIYFDHQSLNFHKYVLDILLSHILSSLPFDDSSLSTLCRWFTRSTRHLARLTLTASMRRQSLVTLRFSQRRWGPKHLTGPCECCSIKFWLPTSIQMEVSLVGRSACKRCWQSW